MNQSDGEDLVLTSAANYYEGVTQQEAEAFYAAQKKADDQEPVMYGMNSRLVKRKRTRVRTGMESWRNVLVCH